MTPWTDRGWGSSIAQKATGDICSRSQGLPRRETESGDGVAWWDYEAAYEEGQAGNWWRLAGQKNLETTAS
jgi:hypothetical protein